MRHAIRILIAEDNPGDVELVREALREYQVDCELFIATDGGEMERYLDRLGKYEDSPCPDLLLLDLNLPKAHGYELLQKFRATTQCDATPVVIMTSSSAPQDRQRAVALGAARYFCKPSDLAEFLKLGSLVRDVVRERGLAAA
jgi:chemotaxis family two-component system response regulator Rcp1